MNRIAALALATFASLAACQNSPQAAPPPPPPPPVVVVNPPAPAGIPQPGDRSVGSAFGGAKHVTLEVHTAGKADKTTKSLDDQIPAVIAALGASSQAIPAMPRCMTPVTFTFADANNVTLGSVGFCDTGTPAEAVHQPGRVDFADNKSMGGFVAANPDALAKLLP